MFRRQFMQLGALAGIQACATPQVFAQAAPSGLAEFNPRLMPKGLRAGSRIGLVAPGYAISPEQLQRSADNLRALGFEPVYTSRILGNYGYLSNTDAERLADLHEMFSREDIDAVVCARGGYGCTRIVEAVDYELIRKNPKPFLGFSDITVLANAIYERTGLITFHGPVANSLTNDFSRESMLKVLRGGGMDHQINCQGVVTPEEAEDTAFNNYTISGGSAEGVLSGGNLSLLVALQGTACEPVYRGKIVFIEDIEEDPYRIDRMFTQLIQSENFRSCAGIALGVFKGCDKPKNPISFKLKDVLTDRLSDLGIPVAYGFSIGHINNNSTLPIGIKARLDADAQTLTLLENSIVG